MSLLRKSLLDVWSPLVTSRRFRGKINIQRPKAPHFERAKYIALSKPYFESKIKDKSLKELCDKNENLKKEEIINPYEKFIAEEALKFFKTSKLIGFYHANPMNALDNFKAFSAFKKEGMIMKNYGKHTLKMAIEDTPYEEVLKFYISRNMLVFSPEVKIKQLLKITKKHPQLTLLAGIYEGKLMNVEELTKYSLIPNLETAQSMLVQTLNSSASKLHRQLNSHQNSLLALLQDRKKQLE